MTAKPFSDKDLKQITGWLNVDGTPAPKDIAQIPKRMLASIAALEKERDEAEADMKTAQADHRQTLEAYRAEIERRKTAEASLAKVVGALDKAIAEQVSERHGYCTGVLETIRRSISDLPAAAKALLEENDRILTGIAEIYQVVGYMAHAAGPWFDHPDVIKALDWLADPSKPCDLLPWPKTPLEDIRAMADLAVGERE